MEIINSPQNIFIKETKKLQQKKYRESKDEFLVEGVRLIEEALKAGSLKRVFYEKSLFNHTRGRELFNRFEQMRTAGSLEYCQEVTPIVLKALAETQTPQGLVAVAAKRHTTLAELSTTAERGLLLIVDGVADPGNLGTLIRTACAAAAEAVICLTGTADCYNAKTIRATMGAVFTVPLIIGEEWLNVGKWCRDKGYRLVAGDAKGKLDFFSYSYPKKTALIVGSEGQGLTAVNPAEVDAFVRIPLSGGV